jgi:hypothetical protein
MHLFNIRMYFCRALKWHGGRSRGMKSVAAARIAPRPSDFTGEMSKKK